MSTISARLSRKRKKQQGESSTDEVIKRDCKRKSSKSSTVPVPAVAIVPVQQSDVVPDGVSVDPNPKASSSSGSGRSNLGKITNEDFFNVPCETLAKTLLGCILCYDRSDCTKGEGGNKVVCKGRIVEAEAYLGGSDKASHSYNGRRTERNEAMYMKPGTCYVYAIYGMYCCINVSSKGEGAAILIRALEPLEGLGEMYKRRKSAKKDKDLCNGPSKLCQAMGIDKSCNKVDMTTSEWVWLERDQYQVEDIVVRSRIGVEYADEWAESPLRFYIKDNTFISNK